jgi:hypothetical protein
VDVPVELPEELPVPVVSVLVLPPVVPLPEEPLLCARTEGARGNAISPTEKAPAQSVFDMLVNFMAISYHHS